MTKSINTFHLIDLAHFWICFFFSFSVLLQRGSPGQSSILKDTPHPVLDIATEIPNSMEEDKPVGAAGMQRGINIRRFKGFKRRKSKQNS